jgi:hypothetical protein
MLTRQYVEALRVDSVLADQVWELWDTGAISDEMAAWAWWLVAVLGEGNTQSASHLTDDVVFPDDCFDRLRTLKA